MFPCALHRLATHSFLVLLLAPIGRTQSALFRIEGTTPGDELGRQFDLVGDIDGDGVVDLVIGLPGDDTVAPDAGRVCVRSGRDGELLFEFFGDHAGDGLGMTVSDAGDVNADGVPDILAGSPNDEDGLGAVFVISGSDAAQLQVHRGLVRDEGYAYAIDAVGDFDGDGHGDYLVGVPFRTNDNSADTSPDGRVFVYSGATGDRVYDLGSPLSRRVRFGAYVSRVGDVDGDGLDDLYASGSSGEGITSGVIAVFSGSDGSLIRAHQGFHPFAGMPMNYSGAGISDVGDVDGDGLAEYALQTERGAGDSRAEIRAGADGEVLYRIGFTQIHFPNQFFLFDADGAGGPDLAICTPHYGPGNFWIYCLADNVELFRLVGVASAHPMGDWNGDGFEEFIVGLPGDDGGGTDAGAIEIYTMNPCGSGTIHCTAAINSTGAGAEIGYVGSSSLSRNDLELRAGPCPTGQAGLFYYAPDPVQFPFGDGFRCAGGGFNRLPLTSTAEGEARFRIDLTRPREAANLTAGSTWSFQFLYRDPMGMGGMGGAGGAGFNGSDGLMLSFCP